MSAKEMFERNGWSYDFVKGNCCEDTIQCRYLSKTICVTNPRELNNFTPIIQFNLMSKLVLINKAMLIDLNILKAIIQQCKELGWLDDRN